MPTGRVVVVIPRGLAKILSRALKQCVGALRLVQEKRYVSRLSTQKQIDRSGFKKICFLSVDFLPDMKSLESVLRESVVKGNPRRHRPWGKILIIVEGVYR